jgi:hydroxymethylbilane synthase
VIPAKPFAIRLGTRGSDLALTQSRTVAGRLEERGATVEFVVVETRGDATDRPFKEIEGKAFFTKELDDALLERRVDLAVHSLKDLPTDDPPDLATIEVLPRADARDLLLKRPGVAIGPGVRVGTSSARRFAQLEESFPGVNVVDLRGNVPTRVAKLRRGDYDAIVIAAAGVARLGLDLADLEVVPLDAPRFLPAPGQGVLAVRLRRGERELAARVRALTDGDTASCARAERRVLEALDGGCSLPLGALATHEDHTIRLLASLATPGDDGATLVVRRARARASQPVAVADAVVRALTSPVTALLTRPDDLNSELAEALEFAGLATVLQPAIEIVPRPIDDALCAEVATALDYDVVAFTSRNSARLFVAAAMRCKLDLGKLRRVAAAGPATAHELEHGGVRASIVANATGGVALADEIVAGSLDARRVLHPGPEAPETAFGERLRAAGLEVTELPLYTTQTVERDPPLPRGLLLVVISSPSAARGFLARPHVQERLAREPASIRLVAFGASSAAELERLGHRPHSVARTGRLYDVVAATVAARDGGGTHRDPDGAFEPSSNGTETQP